MSCPTVYILLSVCDRAEYLMRQVLTMLAGGYDLGNYCLQPVLLKSTLHSTSTTYANDNQLLGTIKDLVSHYSNARQYLKGYSLCKIEVMDPITIPSIPSIEKKVIFWGENQKCVKEVLRWIDAFCLYLKPDFQAGDRILVSLQVEHDASDFSILEAVLSSFHAQGASNNSLMAVCEITPSLFNPSKDKHSLKDLPVSIINALRLIDSYCQQIVIGNREDIHKRDFTCIQHACGILDAIRSNAHGEPVIQGQKTNLYYSHSHLASYMSVESLKRMCLLSLLQNKTTDKELSSWREHLRVSDAQNLWMSPSFSALGLLLDEMRNWQNCVDSADFSFEMDQEDIQIAIGSLNKVKKLEAKSTLNERRKEAIGSLIKAVSDTLGCNETQGRNSVEYFPLSLPLVENKVWVYELGEFPTELSPTQLFEVTDFAFESSFLGDAKARIWRSACIDLWELFFTYRRPRMETIFKVTEYRLSKVANSKFLDLLTLTTIGEMLLGDDIFYRITDKQDNLVAYSSPLTGFCVSVAHGDPIIIDSCPYFSKQPSEVRELSQRNEKVQAFIYAYICMRESTFSDNFRHYVENQTQSYQTQFQARGSDIIRLYPEFRNHVGIDFVEDN